MSGRNAGRRDDPQARLKRHRGASALAENMPLVMDTIDRVPQAGEKGIYLKQQLKDKLIEHRHYITR